VISLSLKHNHCPNSEPYTPTKISRSIKMISSSILLRELWKSTKNLISRFLANQDNHTSRTQHQFEIKPKVQSPELVALQRYSNIDNLNSLSRARHNNNRKAQDLKNQTDGNSSVSSNNRSQLIRPKREKGLGLGLGLTTISKIHIFP